MEAVNSITYYEKYGTGCLYYKKSGGTTKTGYGTWCGYNSLIVLPKCDKSGRYSGATLHTDSATGLQKMLGWNGCNATDGHGNYVGGTSQILPCPSANIRKYNQYYPNCWPSLSYQHNQYENIGPCMYTINPTDICKALPLDPSFVCPKWNMPIGKYGEIGSIRDGALIFVIYTNNNGGSMIGGFCELVGYECPTSSCSIINIT